jgi:hypothetical protein
VPVPNLHVPGELESAWAGLVSSARAKLRQVLQAFGTFARRMRRTPHQLTPAPADRPKPIDQSQESRTPAKRGSKSTAHTVGSLEADVIRKKMNALLDQGISGDVSEE